MIESARKGVGAGASDKPLSSQCSAPGLLPQPHAKETCIDQEDVNTERQNARLVQDFLSDGRALPLSSEETLPGISLLRAQLEAAARGLRRQQLMP